MSSHVEEVDALVVLASQALDEEVRAALRRIRDQVSEVALSWSGSNFGYHAVVYYRDFMPPPAGHEFNTDLGLFEYSMFSVDTTGWERRAPQDVTARIAAGANTIPLDDMKEAVAAAEATMLQVRGSLESILETVLASEEDAYLRRQLEEVRKTRLVQADEVRAAMVSGAQSTRDPTASPALKLAPHQDVAAGVMSFESAYNCLGQLVRLGNQVASHLRRKPVPPGGGLQGAPVGAGKVFIGHGRSKEWLVLRNFVQERLELEMDEYNRIPTAGIQTSDRLQAMLDQAAFALLVLTGEDEQADGHIAARLNVVHEVGLFQGRLGLRRTIVMLEDGCEQFSNIAGLGQIRFAEGNIAAAFEDVRMTLEREGLLVSGTAPAMK